MDKYSSTITDQAKRSSDFLRKNTRWITLGIILLAVLITLIMAILDKYLEHGEKYLMSATYFDIVCVVVCIFLFVNLCIGYGAPKMDYSRAT